MSIQEQIQIVEDNLNEYGQSNITLEEFIYLKDEIYADGCLAGMEQGRADAIEEALSKVRNLVNIECNPNCECQPDCLYLEAIGDTVEILKQLKSKDSRE